MRFQAAGVALGLAASAAAKISLTNPPQFTANIAATEQDVWVVGQTIDLTWTKPDQGKKLSVVLYQMNATMAAGFSGQFPVDDPPFEFITHDQVDATSFRWIVGTTKQLRVSNQFIIAVWSAGGSTTDSATNIFNITNTASTSNNPTSAAGAPPTGLSSPLPAAASSEPGLSSGAYIGIGIAAGIIGGIALSAGLIIFFRQRMLLFLQRRSQRTVAPVSQGDATFGKVTYYQHPTPSSGFPLNEILTDHRAELMPGTLERHELS